MAESLSKFTNRNGDHDDMYSDFPRKGMRKTPEEVVRDSRIVEDGRHIWCGGEFDPIDWTCVIEQLY